MLTIPELLFLVSKGLTGPLELRPSEGGYRQLLVEGGKLFSVQTGFENEEITENSDVNEGMLYIIKEFWDDYNEEQT